MTMHSTERAQKFLNDLSEHISDAENAVSMCDAEDPVSIEISLTELRQTLAALASTMRGYERRR